LPADALVRLTEEGRRAFGSWLSRPAVWAVWWPRFERIARWLIEHEQQRRAHTRMLGSEVDGALVIDAPHGPFTLTAKADRIDRVPGGLGVLDYKTGATPKGKAIELGYAPQLPLEAAIASAGGFTGIAAEPVALLAYWRLSGFDPPGEECVIAEGAEATRLVDAAVAGLRELVARFDDPGTPYLAEPHPGWRPYWNDYAQLARVKEWSLGREIS
jgi:ATP-dependent helicase/nuclease subunit B